MIRRELKDVTVWDPNPRPLKRVSDTTRLWRERRSVWLMLRSLWEDLTSLENWRPR